METRGTCQLYNVLLVRLVVERLQDLLRQKYARMQRASPSQL